MSYTTRTLVAQEFKDMTFPASGGGITTTKVDQWISEADAEIDARLGVKYSVPVTASGALVLLGQIAVWLVKDRILNTGQVKTGDDKTNQGGVKSYRDRALEMLNDISCGKITLSGATLASAADGVRSYTNDNATEHVFKHGVNQW